jgi:hypothetical protein
VQFVFPDPSSYVTRPFKQVLLECLIKIFENPVKTSQGETIIGVTESLTMKDL